MLRAVFVNASTFTRVDFHFRFVKPRLNASVNTLSLHGSSATSSNGHKVHIFNLNVNQ